jgi:hypothetical protein
MVRSAPAPSTNQLVRCDVDWLGRRGGNLKSRSTVLCTLGLLTSLATVLPPSASSSAATSSHRVFYLDLHVGQCAIGPSGSAKYVQVVPCSNPSHDLEVYLVTHGGWSRSTRPSNAVINSRARQICLSNFQRIFGAAIKTPYGYRDYFPDAGAETVKYADRVSCSLTRWPTIGSMGQGTHFHVA